MAEFLKRGNLGAIDIEHGTNPTANPNLDLNNPPPGGGYYGLELVETSDGPELWCSSVRWSDYARKEIESGSRCYASPDWEMDPVTREPLRLNKVALVMEPGTYGIQLLASRKAALGKANMDEIQQLKAAYAGAMALTNSSDEKIKASAAALCESLKASAAALGIDLDAAGEDPAPAAEEQAAEPQEAPAPVQAAEEPKKEMPMAANKVASAGLSLADVQRVIREENAKRDLIEANKDRMTPALINIVASKSLKEARELVGALPPRPVASAPKAAQPSLNAVASAAAPVVEDEATPEERFDIERMRKAFGFSSENLTASREKAAKGDLGLISVTKLEAARKAARQAAN